MIPRITLLLCLAVSANAATVNVSSYGDGSASHTNATLAYNAASAGDTILFPLNASATWSNTLTISKAITLNGNGTTLAQTNAVMDFIDIASLTNMTDLVRVTGFTFQMGDQTSGRVGVRAQTVMLGKLRIDHNTFHYGDRHLILYGSWGVVDHNYFYNGYLDVEWDGGAFANSSWTNMQAGTSEALFIEDNHFIDNQNTSMQERIGTENGGKLVVRYNDFDSDFWVPSYGGALSATAFGPHGSASGGNTNGYWQTGYGTSDQSRRGQSILEYYMNTIHGHRYDSPLNARGSSCLYWSNTIIATNWFGSQTISLREEEYAYYPDPTGEWSASTGYTWGDSCWKLVDGVPTHYYVGSPSTNAPPPNNNYWQRWQWQPPRTNWPAEDQVHNSFFWGNTSVDSSGTTYTNLGVTLNSPAYGIVENRDYFLHEPQATGGSESFTGLNGAAGSYPTDGTLYTNYGTMTFSASGPNAYYPYVPYTYPHPLTGEAPPSPPVDSVTRPIPPSVRNMF